MHQDNQNNNAATAKMVTAHLCLSLPDFQVHKKEADKRQLNKWYSNAPIAGGFEY